MDDEAIYGPVVHKLSFAEAAGKDIICGYKVVISVVDGPTVNNDLMKRGEVIVDGDPVRARQVANQIAVQETVKRFGVRRIMTFHSTVKAAESFAKKSGEGIGTHLPDFDLFHVNGKQSTAVREDFLKDFKEAERGLITNARCLTEGVDVPAVDMVAFVAPKKSKVDIVQATGRAMRKAGPEKTTGYVLLPLFLEQNADETIEEALERSNFDEVANVLNAMRDHDEELVDIIREMREELGRTGGYDESRFEEKVEFLGPEISLSALRKAITAKTVELLGDNWDERYGELVAYKERFGDCDVPARWIENPRLSRWCGNQRTRKAKVRKERIKRLDELGFVWDHYESYWEEMFQALLAYKDRFGDCNVPARWEEDPRLSTWCGTQRADYKSNNLRKEHIKRLDELGFVWDAHKTLWEEMFQALLAYKDRFGDCNVPINWDENVPLGHWCFTQRQRNRKNELEKVRYVRLEAIGFIWDRLTAQWEEMFQALVTYKARFGDCNVANNWKENPKLSRWCGTQRTRKTRLKKERLTRLEAIGFVWDRSEAFWEEMFQALVAYKKEHQDCNVPARWKPNPQLGTWCDTQRQNYRKGKFSKDRIGRLEALGFSCKVRGST